jgi:hypothetical protein
VGGGILDDASNPPSSSKEEEGPASFVTILTDANVQRATEILRKHGLVIIKGLLPPSQTVPWRRRPRGLQRGGIPPEVSSYQTG